MSWRGATDVIWLFGHLLIGLFAFEGIVPWNKSPNNKISK
jgi:hypothetical protein